MIWLLEVSCLHYI